MLNYLFKQKLVFSGLAIWALFLGILPNLSQASLVESKTGVPQQCKADLAKVKLFLENSLVRRGLERTKLSKEELLKRVEKLDADQLHELAMRCDRIKVGGSGGILLVILIVGLVIIAILYVTNYTIKVEPRDAIPRRY